MKLLITSILLLISTIGYSQKSFPEGIYKSTLGDIIIRNDSIISKNINFFAYQYNQDKNFKNGITTITYTSEDKKQQLKVTHKDYSIINIILYHKDNYKEYFNASFEEKIIRF